MQPSANLSDGKRVIGRPFVKGEAPGRPKGSKSKLGEAFWTDLYGAWQKHGSKAIHEMARKAPVKFVQVVASVMPKEVHARFR